MILLLFLIIGCSFKDSLGPTLNEKREAVEQAIINLNLQDKDGYLSEAYLNNLLLNDLVSLENFINVMESDKVIEEKISLIIEYFNYYDFRGQKYNLNIEIKQKIKESLKGNIVTNKQIISLNETLKRINDNIDAAILSEPSMNIEFIKKVLKIYNQLIKASLLEKKLEIVSDFIFGAGSKSYAIKKAIKNNVKMKDLKILDEEVKRILSIKRGE